MAVPKRRASRDIINSDSNLQIATVQGFSPSVPVKQGITLSIGRAAVAGDGWIFIQNIDNKRTTHVLHRIPLRRLRRDLPREP